MAANNLNTIPPEQPTKSIWQRLFILLGAALVLWLLFFWIAAPSERFHALLIPLWIVNFVLTGRRLNKLSVAIVGAITVVGFFGFYALGSLQAAQLDSYLAWWEPIQKLYFTAGLFVLYNVLCGLINGLLTLIPAARELLTAPRGGWLRLIRTGVTLLLFAPYIYVAFNIHRFKYTSGGTPQSRCSLPFQSVDFRAIDGVKLKGWYIPKTGSRRTIVVVHGIGSNRGDMLNIVPFLHRAGFNLFLFDLRGHGESSGHTITFGVNEARDVEAATWWASQKSGGKSVQAPVGVLAYSMGGSSVLHAVGQNGLPLVQPIVLDSTFAEFAPLAREQLAFLPDAMAAPMLAVLSFYTRLEIGVGLNDIAPCRYIGSISPRPLLLIHGTGDHLIAAAQARLNYASARPPKALYLIDGAEHCAGHRVAGAAYEKRVVRFFAESLK